MIGTPSDDDDPRLSERLRRQAGSFDLPRPDEIELGRRSAKRRRTRAGAFGAALLALGVAGGATFVTLAEDDGTNRVQVASPDGADKAADETIEGDDRGRLRAVRYNNRSAAPADVPFDEMAGFYDAYRTFADLLHRSELEVRFTLAPGVCLVFDNERVLHGREGESDPGRYLQGCYVDRDWIHGRR